MTEAARSTRAGGGSIPLHGFLMQSKEKSKIKTRHVSFRFSAASPSLQPTNLTPYSTHGIEMNIPAQFKQIGFLFDQHRLIPTLKEVPHPLVASIEIGV